MKAKKFLRHWIDFINDVRWLFQIVWRKHYVKLTILLFVSVGIATSSLLQAYSNSVLINTIVNSVSHFADDDIYFALILVSLSIILPAIFYLLEAYYEKNIYFFLSKHFDILVEQKRIELDVSQYENSEFNNFVNRVNEKGAYVIGNIITNLFYNFQSVITVLISSIIIAKQSFVIFLIILFSAVPAFIVGTKYGNEGWYIWGNGINAEDRRKYWSIKDFIRNLSSLTEIKLFGLGNFLVNKIGMIIDSVEKTRVKNERRNLQRHLVATLFAQGILIGSTLFFIHEAIVGHIAVGTIILLLGSMVGFQNSLSALFSSLGKQQEDRLYLHDLILFVRHKATMVDGNIEANLSSSPQIKLDNVRFAYPNSDKTIFESLSLTIAPGEKLAIVGLNGAGKTTLIKLLCRFYDPTSGQILINDVPLNDLKRASWYSNIGVLFQDYAKFNFSSVGELISYGDISKDRDNNKIDLAIEKSDAGFVRKWGNIHEQQLSKEYTNGVEPSGGQWQKLALARLFYRDPKIYILDEPTSSIDADAESKIFESLSELPKDKTVILISHRFSTVRTADRIVVIDEGKIREVGNHDELIKLNGEYARLFNLQAVGYK